ncbi:hypothetical protein UFOVP606_17 [uncultured Caudovirales phage]|uniref:Uncharacterized protein n=1 Tax=uncultured Caudovirales phage TaxID=2100421 RepID=A0A6J5N1N5_9CAUD|nr:hypothetical protein UFOVP606_17 [uncultured Caudovirales phage]
MIQGEDIQIRLTITDGTTPIQPSTLNAYSVVVYYLASGRKTVLATFLNTNVGLFDIVVYDDALGKIDIILNRNITARFPEGEIYAEVFIQETASSEFINALANSGVSQILLFSISRAANPTVI